MGKRDDNHYSKIIKVLQEIKKVHPTITLGQHISTALSEYGDIWGLTDREFLYAIERYRSELEWLKEEVPEESIEEIIKASKDLDKLLDDGNEED